MIIAARIAIIAALAIVIVLMVSIIRARAQTSPDDWFRLVIVIQDNQHKLDADDRWFVRSMVNKLTADAAAMPNPPEQRWLLDIKRRLHIVFVSEGTEPQ
jgi:hypothetical protein